MVAVLSAADAMVRVGLAPGMVEPKPGAPAIDLPADRPGAELSAWLAAHVRWASQPLALVSRGEAPNVSAAIHAHYETAQINENTVGNEAAKWARNFCTNLRRSPAWATSVNRSLRGMPAVIVGAGISLERDIEHLPAAMRKAAVIACNTAAPVLRAHGITPDLIMCSEAIDSSKHLAGFEDVPVALDILSHPAGWEARPDAFAFCKHEPNLVPYLCELGVCPLDYTAAVFCAAVSLAAWLGASPIVLIGQNLGFADGRMYAAGSPYDDLRYHVLGGVTYTTGRSKQIAPMPELYRKGTDGARVLSNASFNLEAAWLASASKKVSIAQMAHGGAQIGGHSWSYSFERWANAQDHLCEPIADRPTFRAMPIRTDSLRASIRRQCEAYLADPSMTPTDFHLLHMYRAPVAIAQGRDDPKTRAERFVAAGIAGAREMLEILS